MIAQLPSELLSLQLPLRGSASAMLRRSIWGRIHR